MYIHLTITIIENWKDSNWFAPVQYNLCFNYFLILGLLEKTVPKVLKSCGLKKCSLKLHYKTDPSSKAENHQHKPLKDCKDQKLTQCKNNKD